MKEQNSMNIYWANLCILNRMEAEKMEKKASEWSANKNVKPEMIYLGDTEDVHMYEKLDSDIAKGELGFDLVVSTRFDIFCSKKYLQGFKDYLFPLEPHFNLRDEAKKIQDPSGLLHPLALLPHFIVANTDLINKSEVPSSLEQLLDPYWKEKVYLGSTDLPSAKSVLFTMWFLFGKEGLDTCVRNWRQKSAPSAVRFGAVKGECPIALLPGIFAGPGPGENLAAIHPAEGAPLLPSYAAVKRSEKEDDTLDFLKHSVGGKDFTTFYKNQALAYPTDPEVATPENFQGKMIFPPWEWIDDQDMEYFNDMCKRMPVQ